MLSSMEYLFRGKHGSHSQHELRRSRLDSEELIANSTHRPLRGYVSCRLVLSCVELSEEEGTEFFSCWLL